MTPWNLWPSCEILLDYARVDESAAAELDLFQCLDLVEKTITMLGQSNVTMAHFHREGFSV